MREPDTEGVTIRRGLSRFAIALGGLALIAVIGFLSAGAGWITCNEDVQSPEQAPHLCGTLGSGAGLWLPPLVGAIALLALVLAGVRTKALGFATVFIVAAEGALLVMWALVSHGTIHY
jgi:hypothetical protein